MSEVTIQSLIQTAQNMGLSNLSKVWNDTYIHSTQAPHVRITILGEFNHGKSSLMNALIGQNILPSGMTPTTQVDTWMYFGANHKKVVASHMGTLVKTWTWDDWCKLSVKKISDFIKTASVDRLEIHIDDTPFDTDCVFIDTPGLNEASLARESYLSRYLTNADVVIFILDANQALTRTEQNVFHQLAKNLTSQQRLLVINKCDRLEANEWLEICHYVEEALAQDMANERFYMVSARHKEIGDWQDLLDELHQRIQTLKLGSQEAAQKRAIREMSLILEGCSMVLDALSQMPSQARPQSTETNLSTQKLADIVSHFSTEIQRLETQTFSDLERFKTDFIKAMPRELDKAQLEDIEKWFESFIDEEFCQYARSYIRRITESLSCVLQELCAKLQIGDIPFVDVTFPMESLEYLMAHAVPTGAFEATQGLNLWQLPIPLPPMAERPRRESLKNMAQKAIELRTEQYQNAFHDFFNHQNDVWSTVVRECGYSFSEMLAQK